MLTNAMQVDNNLTIAMMDMTEKKVDSRLQDPFFTRTMAELMENQGHLEDALIIYKILAKRSPDNDAVRAGVVRLEERARELTSRHRRHSGRRA
jgi:hypothetical protein